METWESGVQTKDFPLSTPEKKAFLYQESDEVLEQLPREAVDTPSIPGGVQGQVGCVPGQPGLVLNGEVGGPACGAGGGGLDIHDPWGSFQTGPFCDSMILCEQ